MATALNIFTTGTTLANLNNIQVGMFETMRKESNAFKFKSNNADLSKKAGSYEFKRPANSTVKVYGTARTAGKGDALSAPGVVVNLDDPIEVVEEVEDFDIGAFGLEASAFDYVKRRATNHQMSIMAYLGRKFWKEAWLAAVAGDNLHIAPAADTTTYDADLEAIIVDLETTKNDYVDGVNRAQIGGVLYPTEYSKLKTKLNAMYNANFAVDKEEISGINGVALFSELYLPTNVTGVIMAKESIAQPITMAQYSAEQIQLSNAVGFGLFGRQGTKALASDLIHAMIKSDGTHTAIARVAALPSSDISATTFYVTTAASTGYDSADATAYDNFPAGTILTYTTATTTWAVYGG